MDSVGRVVAAAIPSCIGPVLKNIAYPFKVSDNKNALDKATATLKAAQTDVKNRAEIDELQGKTQTALVTDWLGQVEKVKGEVEDIRRRYEERSRCFGSQSFNCWSNFSISKDAAKKLIEVQELREEVDKFTEVAIQLPPQVPELPIGSEVVVPKEEANFHEILRYINSDQNGIFGIWGMGGVGKTRLLHLIHNYYKENSANFDVVVKVTASKECSVDKLQAELCEKCGFGRETSVESQARIISNYLTKRNFLILLDDLWGKIDLEKVGIPIGLSNQFKKKVVITTRSKSVYYSMNVKESLKVVGLETKDALRLFYEIVGDKTIESHNSIPRLAEVVVEELDGLPLALIIIGASMRGKKHPREWEDRIYSLRKSRLNGIDEEEKLFHRLKLSYDSMNEKSQHCFLVCSLWPEDYIIKKIDLIECWLGLGLLDLFDARNIYNPGYDVINELLSACLLEEEGSKKVKMHDIIRDMGNCSAHASLAQILPHFFKNDINTAHDEGKKKDKWVSFNEIVLNQMRHKNISWSLVERASVIHNGHDGWLSFEGKVPLIPCDARRLQFARVRSHFLTAIEALVQNVSIFRDLVFLELSNCNLISFPQGISELVKLEHLNLYLNQITSVPEELKNVKNLRFLSLRHNSIYSFPKGVLPELKELMVLDLYTYFPYNSGSGGDEHWTRLINELSCLGKLRCLSIVLRQPIHFRNLLELSDLPVRTLCLDYKNETGTLEIPCSFIGKAQDNLHKLQLEVGSVRKLVIRSNCQNRLGNLEFLSFTMHELEMIEWPWNITPEDLLPMLHDLLFKCCPRLKDVSWTLYLPCLRILELYLCHHIVQLFERVGGSGGTKCTFPSLVRLKLRDLPGMEIICDKSITFPSLEQIEIIGCPKLKKLPFQSSGKLKTIDTERECWERLEWEDNELKQDFRDLVLYRSC